MLTSTDEDLNPPGNDDRPLRYTEPDPENPGGTLVIYRASALNTCQRAVIACAQGLPAEEAPAHIREIWQEGHDAEPITSAMWDEHTGTPTTGSQERAELDLGFVDGNRVVIRCSRDGMAVYPDTGRRVLREFKKIRESGWEKFKRSGVEIIDHYPWQLSAYMLAFELDEAEFVGGKFIGRNKMGRPVIDEVYGHVYASPPINLRAIRDRVLSVERLIAQGYVASDVACDRKDYPCPWFKFHDEKTEVQEDPARNVVLDDTNEDVNVAAKELFAQLQAVDVDLAAARAATKAAETARKNILEGIRGLAEDAGANPDDVDRIAWGVLAVTITRSEVKEHTRAASTRVKYALVAPEATETTVAINQEQSR